MNVGDVYVKIAGRDAGLPCVIVDILDDRHVLIDGATRRRKCNKEHLESLQQSVELKKGASHEEVKIALEPLNIQVRETNPRQKGAKPVRLPKEKKHASKKVVGKTKEKKGQKEEVKKGEKPAGEKKKVSAKVDVAPVLAEKKVEKDVVVSDAKKE